MAKVSELYDVTWEEMRDKMRKWREENHRNSEQIVEVGEELINEYASKLGDDIWIIYEQVMIAALDCSRDDLALFCLQELRRQFPGSHRVKRLTGMRFEYMERYDDALQLYDRILQEDSTNTSLCIPLHADPKPTEANGKSTFENCQHTLEIHVCIYAAQNNELLKCCVVSLLVCGGKCKLLLRCNTSIFWIYIVKMHFPHTYEKQVSFWKSFAHLSHESFKMKGTNVVAIFLLTSYSKLFFMH
ncbi:ER membrane protein complex subunit 2 isoform X3 [Eretmochelys imbricata]